MQHLDAVESAVRSFAAAMIGELAHELNNRLATMRETVGLLEDLARAGKAGAAGTAKAHASLDDQVGRSLNIIRTLGGLGGAFESSDKGFDAGAAIGDLLAMTERWARRRSLAVGREVAADLPRAAGDAALFLCLVHRLIVRCAETQGAEGGVLLRVERVGDRILVRLGPMGSRQAGTAVPALDDEVVDRELALRLGGELVLEGGGAATIALAAAR
jgi:hypothetical protein